MHTQAMIGFFFFFFEPCFPNLLLWLSIVLSCPMPVVLLGLTRSRDVFLEAFRIFILKMCTTFGWHRWRSICSKLFGRFLVSIKNLKTRKTCDAIFCFSQYPLPKRLNSIEHVRQYITIRAVWFDYPLCLPRAFIWSPALNHLSPNLHISPLMIIISIL